MGSEMAANQIFADKLGQDTGRRLRVEAQSHLVCSEPNIWVFDDLLPESFLHRVDDLLDGRRHAVSESTGGHEAVHMVMETARDLEDLVSAVQEICRIDEVERCPRVVVSEIRGQDQSPHMDHGNLEQMSSIYRNLQFVDLSRQSLNANSTIVPTFSIVVYFNAVGGVAFPNARPSKQTVWARRGRIVVFQNYVDGQRPAHCDLSRHYGLYERGVPKRLLTMGILANRTPSLATPCCPRVEGLIYCPKACFVAQPDTLPDLREVGMGHDFLQYARENNDYCWICGAIGHTDSTCTKICEKCGNKARLGGKCCPQEQKVTVTLTCKPADSAAGFVLTGSSLGGGCLSSIAIQRADVKYSAVEADLTKRLTEDGHCPPNTSLVYLVPGSTSPLGNEHRDLTVATLFGLKEEEETRKAKEPDAGSTSSKALKQQLKKKFRRLDTNGDGCLSLKEMSNIFTQLGSDITPDDVKILFDAVDKNHDGHVDLDEFFDFLLPMDTNQDGKISKSEMRYAVEDMCGIAPDLT